MKPIISIYVLAILFLVAATAQAFVVVAPPTACGPALSVAPPQACAPAAVVVAPIPQACAPAATAMATSNETVAVVRTRPVLRFLVHPLRTIRARRGATVAAAACAGACQ
jgi:hypothetical protein